MPRKKLSADALIEKYQITDLQKLYQDYMTNSKRQVVQKYNLPEYYIIQILEQKGFDISIRNENQARIAKNLRLANVTEAELYDLYLKNGYSYISRKTNLSRHQVEEILINKGYDLSKRLPQDEIANKNGYSVQELVEKNNIDVEALYDTYMNNGGLYTAHQFGLSNSSLVLRILKKYDYDISNRNSKKINYDKTIATIKKKYGVESALSIPASKEKLKSTNLKKFGSEYYMGTQSFIDKSKQTNLDKYGYAWSTQSPEVKLRHEQANYLKYGVKDFKQKNCSVELKKYLNDRDKSIEFLTEKNFTFFDLKSYFSEDSESQIYSWLCRFKLYDYLQYLSRSASEAELADFLAPYGFSILNSRKLLGNGQEIDIYNPDLKIGIEFNGIYYHSSAFIADKNYHIDKSKIAEQNSIRLIHIYENEWHDLKQRQKLISFLRVLSGNVENKIYARKCEIRKISNKEAKIFNDSYHLQNHRNAQITYGLYFNEELKQLMSFSVTNRRKNINMSNDWEIIRICSAADTIIVGGMSRMFKHFSLEFHPDSIVSYCDFNKFDGKSYAAIGMEFAEYTEPDKNWVIGYDLVGRNSHRYHELKNTANACLWGAGNKKYIWENTKQIVNQK